MGLVPLCYRAFVGPKFLLVGISWVVSQFFLCVFCGFFVVGILRVTHVFLAVFRESGIFSRDYLMGPIFFLVGITWVQDFFS